MPIIYMFTQCWKKTLQNLSEGNQKSFRYMHDKGMKGIVFRIKNGQSLLESYIINDVLAPESLVKGLFRNTRASTVLWSY